MSYYTKLFIKKKRKRNDLTACNNALGILYNADVIISILRDLHSLCQWDLFMNDILPGYLFVCCCCNLIVFYDWYVCVVSVPGITKHS